MIRLDLFGMSAIIVYRLGIIKFGVLVFLRVFGNGPYCNDRVIIRLWELDLVFFILSRIHDEAQQA